LQLALSGVFEENAMMKQLKILVYILYAFLALLALGWVWGAATNWDEIASRPVRLAYIICDFAIVLPAGIAAAVGLQKDRPWAYTLFPFVLGALLFDTAHGVFYLLWDNYFGVSQVIPFGLLVALAIYTYAALRAVQDRRRVEA
jgi:hypothetical protein